MRNMYEECSKETIEKDLGNTLKDIEEMEGFNPNHAFKLATQQFLTIYRVAEERNLFNKKESQEYKNNYFETINKLMDDFWVLKI